jgi:sec-independent protein translocase protein TatA
MNNAFFAMLGWPEIVGIGVIVLVLFGAKKVPELMRGLGHGIKEFKRATREVQDDLQRSLEEEPPPPPRRTESTVARSSEEAEEGDESSAKSKSAEPHA